MYANRTWGTLRVFWVRGHAGFFSSVAWRKQQEHFLWATRRARRARQLGTHRCPYFARRFDKSVSTMLMSV
jgi:hypothetical protein